jgi:hypothetical protein
MLYCINDGFRQWLIFLIWAQTCVVKAQNMLLLLSYSLAINLTTIPVGEII